MVLDRQREFRRFTLQGLAALAALSLTACAAPEAEFEPDVPNLAQIEQGVLGRVNSATSFIVFSQNMKQLKQSRWRDMIRCMGDTACNGAGGVPDIFLLSETSDVMAQQIIDQLKAPVSAGGLGIAGWGKYAVDNWRTSSDHWMSNVIIYNADRFTRTDMKAIEFETGDGTAGSCAKSGTYLPFLKLRDDLRQSAGYSNVHVSLVVRHDDHFGTTKITCPNPVANSEFCTWNNSKIINANMYSATIQIMAGDWNYHAKYCTYDGVAYPGWKYAYECTTKGLACTASGGNLGFSDPRLNKNPAVYDTSSPIDYIHYKGAYSVSIPSTPRNSTPGVIGKHFYCTGHDAYGGSPDDTMWTDHDGLMVKFTYSAN
jgi:hypothetical protein